MVEGGGGEVVKELELGEKEVQGGSGRRRRCGRRGRKRRRRKRERRELEEFGCWLELVSGCLRGKSSLTAERRSQLDTEEPLMGGEVGEEERCMDIVRSVLDEDTVLDMVTDYLHLTKVLTCPHLPSPALTCFHLSSPALTLGFEHSVFQGLFHLPCTLGFIPC